MATPEQLLHGFMTEMNAWELRCAERTEQCVRGELTFDRATEIGVSEYMDIFRRYCSQSKGVPRDFYYTEPPDYDPDRELILNATEMSPVLFSLRTQQNYSHRKSHLFSFTREDGQWRLFARHILMVDGSVLESNL